jgi:hypothetical protein
LQRPTYALIFQTSAAIFVCVMRGLDPRIQARLIFDCHAFADVLSFGPPNFVNASAWMRGSSPRMTAILRQTLS